MGADGLVCRGLGLGVLMAIPCKIAFAAAPNALSLYRSLILRPPPSSVAFRSITIMNNRQSHTTAAAVTDIDAIFKQKRALRSRVKKELKNMDPTLRSYEDNAIQNVILEAPWFKTCKRLCAYISCSALREVDTSNILSEVLQNPATDGHSLTGKKLYVPRVEDRNRNMRMVNISSVRDMIANSMNILEPAPVDADGNDREDVMQANDPVDVLLLPGLAFDKSGRRLGRGGGYYDTFLMNYQELAKERKWKQPLLVALSYSVQIMDDGVIPVTPTDVPVDALVTPSGLIPISPAAMERCH
ncbi:hypothetical protein RHGRI_024253 [Rhododendron griersonianum]|uniref:5-formyltetrahydrofolate cyclo-ligase n=1 Tax=Rhododendron griersonianum TaxID=479676 RepID=A0AAV6J6R3_9ERIC|nr:hypothetical protein RHGRI_024253 [Rhododendron griersonianum]